MQGALIGQALAGDDPTDTSFEYNPLDGIVNAANLEVQFGGGISGAIAITTHDKANIDLEAAKGINQFWSDYEGAQAQV